MVAEQVKAWLVQDTNPSAQDCASVFSPTTSSNPHQVFQDPGVGVLGVSPVPCAWSLSCLDTFSATRPGVGLSKTSF